MTTNIESFKKLLLEEKAQLEKELSSVGRINPSNPKDWEPTPDKDEDVSHADKNESADAIEDYEENTAILRELEIRYNQVLAALKKIEDGTYGICSVGGEQIPEERLKANPAATTCTNHAQQE